jgi:hypothetical protein
MLNDEEALMTSRDTKAPTQNYNRNCSKIPRSGLPFLAKNDHVYVMSRKTKEIILALKNIEEILCHKCGHPIDEGMPVVSLRRGRGRNNPVKIYHRECFESIVRY